MNKRKSVCLKPYPLGAHIEDDLIRFSFVSEKTDCGILIYDKRTGKKQRKIAFESGDRIGNVWCKCLAGLDAAEISYQFYEEGTPVPDRNARMYVRKGQATYGRGFRECDLRALIPSEDFDWEGDASPRIPYHESVCYCVHVRGFTKHASSEVAHRGTFAGMVEKLDYLRQIGITTVELQPAYEFAEMPTEEECRRLNLAPNVSFAVENAADFLTKKCNYWGYKQGFYYAPKAAYAASADAVSEFKQMVKAFHQNGLEIVMQFYFPREVNRLDIPEILRFWVMEYHIDGFHLMGENLPVNMIAADPVLADTKLWYYYFDADFVYGREGLPMRKNLAVYQDDYLYAMRRFLKGDEGMLESVMEQMRQVPEKMGRIHYMSNYYGFTLMDMVSYDRKHNEANGEDNRDGNDYNCSWNCGEEGASRRKKTVELRHRQIMNAITMLLFSQSTPLIFMGDEFGNSQRGNNNPYCQDNSVTWLDWRGIEKNRDIYDYWRRMVKFRREHPILHPEMGLRVMDYICCGYPDLSYHGQNAWRPRTESYNRHIGMMFCGKYAKVNWTQEDQFLYLALNMYWQRQELALPKLPRGLKWEKCCNTMEVANSNRALEDADAITPEGIVTVPERSISIYMSVPDGSQMDEPKRKKGKLPKAEDYQDRTAF